MRGTSRIVIVALFGALAAVSPAAAQGPSGGETPPPTLVVTSHTEVLDGAVGGVAVDRLGYVYVADFGERVWKVDPYGGVTVFAGGLYGASGNCLDGEGRLYQSSFWGGTVSRVSRTGEATTVARGLAGPVGVAVDEDGVLTVCECRANRLARVGADGRVGIFAESALFNCPNGLTRGPDGSLYVANFSDGRVLKVDPAGAVSELAVLPSRGNGHLVWAAGALWVTGFRSNQIYEVTSDGAYEVVAGNGGFGAENGPGAEASFSTPNGIAYDSVRDVLYVNDYLTPLLRRNREPPRSLLRRLAFPKLPERLAGALEHGGVGAMTAAYRDYKSTRPGRFTEVEANVFGYGLLSKGNVDAARRVFELNAESYPLSANAWDSLAEAWAAAGDRGKAISFYRKSLELDPGNRNAVEKLSELGAS